MRKDSKKFYKFFFEAIKNRNEFGIDFEKDKKQNFLFQPDGGKDYTYHGIYKRKYFSKTREDDTFGNLSVFYKDGKLSDKIKKRILLKKQLKKLEADSQEMALFQDIKNIENAKTSQMRADLLEVSKEISLIKNQKNSFDYQSNLKKILQTFFMVPGAKLARRYIFLPVKRNFSMNDVNLLNKSGKFDKNLLNDILNKKEEVKNSQIDEEIIKYLKSVDYYFKTPKDFQNNICYTRNGAQVKISDEFKKINLINLEQKTKALEKTKDIKTVELIKKEIEKKKNLKDEYLKRIDYLEIQNEDSGDKAMRVIVLTWVPRLIMSQSTTTIWKSCMSLPSKENFSGGINKHYVAGGIDEGVFIAWLLKIGDEKEMDEPIARILIKPYVIDDVPQEWKFINLFWLPSKVYTDGSNTNDINIFKDAVGNFCYHKQKREIDRLKNKVFSVKQGRVYSDTDDQRKPVYTLKSYFKNLEENMKSNASFFQTSDFSVNKAMAYLKKIDFEKPVNDRYSLINKTALRKFLKFSLDEQNLTIFEYLSKIDETVLKSTINDFFKKDISVLNSYRFGFLSYLFKYYLNEKYLDQNELRDFVLKILTSKTKNTISDLIFKNNYTKYLFDKNDYRKNYIVIDEIIRSGKIDYFENIINSLITNNLIPIYFSLDSKDVNFFSVYECFLTLDSFNTKKVKPLWEKMEKIIDQTVSVDFIEYYFQKTIDEINENETIKRRIIKYLKILKNKKITSKNIKEKIDDFLNKNKGNTISSEFFEVLYETQIDENNPDKLDFNILMYFDYKKMIKMIPFFKNGDYDYNHLIIQIGGIMNSFRFINNQNEEVESMLKLDEKKIDLEKKIIYLFSNHQKEIDFKSNVFKDYFLDIYCETFPILNKQILQTLKNEDVLSEEIIDKFLSANTNYFPLENLKYNTKLLLEISGKKIIKNTVNLSDFIFTEKLKHYNQKHTDLYREKLNFILDYVDINDIFEGLKILEKKNLSDNIIKYYFINLNMTKLVKKFLEIEMSDSLYSKFVYYIYVTNLNNFNKYTDSLNKNFEKINFDADEKNFINNVKLIFKNDFEYATKIVFENIQEQNKEFFVNNNLSKLMFLAKVFEVQPEVFYKNKNLIEFVKKNNQHIKIEFLMSLFEDKNSKIFDQYIAPILGEEAHAKKISLLFNNLKQEFKNKDNDELNTTKIKQIKNEINDFFKNSKIEKMNLKQLAAAMTEETDYFYYYLQDEINENNIEQIEDIYIEISKRLKKLKVLLDDLPFEKRNEKNFNLLVNKLKKYSKDGYEKFTKMLDKSENKKSVYSLLENKPHLFVDNNDLNEFNDEIGKITDIELNVREKEISILGYLITSINNSVIKSLGEKITNEEINKKILERTKKIYIKILGDFLPVFLFYKFYLYYKSLQVIKTETVYENNNFNIILFHNEINNLSNNELRGTAWEFISDNIEEFVELSYDIKVKENI